MPLTEQPSAGPAPWVAVGVAFAVVAAIGVQRARRSQAREQQRWTRADVLGVGIGVSVAGLYAALVAAAVVAAVHTPATAGVPVWRVLAPVLVLTAVAAMAFISAGHDLPGLAVPLLAVALFTAGAFWAVNVLVGPSAAADPVATAAAAAGAGVHAIT